MAVITLWAGTTSTTPSQWSVSSNRLPSPVSFDATREEIWDENAGRNASGEMIATLKANKRTYNVKWGVLTSAEYDKITSLLSPSSGWFRFAWNTNPDTPKTSGGSWVSYVECYRSEITYSTIQIGSEMRYKDLSVSIIEK